MGDTRFETIAESAERLSVSTKTVRRMIATGDLTGYRIGSHLVRVRVDDVNALLRPIPTVGRTA